MSVDGVDLPSPQSCLSSISIEVCIANVHAHEIKFEKKKSVWVNEKIVYKAKHTKNIFQLLPKTYI